MLSRADAELVRREVELPGLAIALDPEALVGELRVRLPEWEIEAADPKYTRFKSGTNCVVAYRIQTNVGELEAYAKVYSAKSTDKFDKALRGREVSGRRHRTPLGASGVMFFIFPDDPKLEALWRLNDLERLRKTLSRTLSDHPELWGGSLHGVRYNPERRWVARLDDGAPRAALKFYTPEAFSNASCAAKHLKSRGALRLARRLGNWKRRFVLGLDWMGGAPLMSVLREVGPDCVIPVGRALVDLHAQRERRLRRRLPAFEETALRDAARDLIAIDRPAGESARRILDRIGSGAEDARIGVVHGDFHVDQILLDGDRVVVLDLDRACEGSGTADLGTFAAQLLRDAVLGALPMRLAEDAAAALLEGYASRAGISRVAVDREVALALVRVAAEPFRRRVPHWPELTAEILARAEQRAAANPVRRSSALPARPPVRIEAGGAAGDEDLQRIELALDPGSVEPVLDRLLAEPQETLRLLGIRVIRHRPGRRALLEYELDRGQDGDPGRRQFVLGKLRRRGPDHPTFSLAVSLFRGGFSSSAEDGICVPEPIGIDSGLGMWFQHKVPGEMATRLLSGPAGDTLAMRIAEALRKFHAAQLPTRGRHGTVAELEILEERLGKVAAANPAWRQRLDRVFNGCEKQLAAIGDPRSTGIHRDFYSDQVLVERDRLFVLDFDLYTAGDPALDIGNFNAHLTEQALRLHGDPDALASREHALTERYCELDGRDLRRAASAYSIASLARLIHVSTRIAERNALTLAMLETCEERLGLARHAAT